MIEQIQQWVEQHREDILELNRKLVCIPSENLYPNGNELHVQLEVKKHLEHLGFETDLFLPTDVSGITEHEAFLNDGRNYHNRPNVVGVLKGKGEGKSLLFSGHMDTVPLGVETWTRSPFKGEVIGDKQYGLGIFDMKGGMAASIMAAQCIQELGFTLNGDLMIETVVDEEFGGANGTLASRLRGYKADAAIIPEPTNLAICPVNHGGAYYRVIFEGKSGRSYSGEKLTNPIFAAGRFFEIIQAYHTWRNVNAKKHPMFENQELVTLVQKIEAGNKNIDLSDRVPNRCSLDLWIQCYPGVTEEALLQEFKDFYQPLLNQDEILSVIPPKLEKKIRFLPGTGVEDDDPILKVLIDSGKQIQPSGFLYQGAPFACDSFMFNLYSDTPAVILGPRGGNAHSTDEFIFVDDFMTLVEMYALTILNWCGVRK